MRKADMLQCKNVPFTYTMFKYQKVQVYISISVIS